MDCEAPVVSIHSMKYRVEKVSNPFTAERLGAQVTPQLQPLCLESRHVKKITGHLRKSD